MKQHRFLVVAGPTASGKTAVSVGLAKALGAPVISADSMQIYRGCDIGTAKATPRDMQGVSHHMLDIAGPEQAYSVAEYQRAAFALIERYNAGGIAPVVAGGTGLYINSLVYMLDFGRLCPHDTIRQKYTQLADDKSTENLYNILKQTDPEYASLIAGSDRRRIVRRLELLEAGDAGDYDFRRPNTGDLFLMMGLKLPRDVLCRRIDRRVDDMIAKGLEDEARRLLEEHEGANAAKAIGYKEFGAYFRKEASWQETIELIKRNTRRYAKRQMTWFRRDERIQWFDVCAYPCLEDLIDDIITYAKGKGF